MKIAEANRNKKQESVSALREELGRYPTREHPHDAEDEHDQ
jgi:hypothetical protein